MYFGFRKEYCLNYILIFINNFRRKFKDSGGYSFKIDVEFYLWKEKGFFFFGKIKNWMFIVYLDCVIGIEVVL